MGAAAQSHNESSHNKFCKQPNEKRKKKHARPWTGVCVCNVYAARARPAIDVEKFLFQFSQFPCCSWFPLLSLSFFIYYFPLFPIYFADIVYELWPGPRKHIRALEEWYFISVDV